MKQLIGSVLLAACCGATTISAAADPEMRAIWVSRFEWASSGASAQTTRNRIDTIMSTIQQNNFNAVLFQVRGQCDVLYPSPYEPWGRPFGWTDPGWDPLAYAIQSAHSRGLEFHAYINTHTMSQDTPPAVTSPQHLLNSNGPTSAEPWVIHDINGVPQSTVDGYVWISPGIPAAEAWTRRSVMHVVENYDVDGVHFDRIRTPGNGYSYDPTTVARFNGEGNPNGLEWGDFMRSQITEQLRRIQGEIALVKPHVKTSAAPFGIVRRVDGGYQGTGTQSYFEWYQDSFGWMQEHVLDCLFPQIYWDIGSAHPYEVLLADFQRFDGDRHIYPGSVSPRDYIAQVAEARRQGALGTTVFSFNSIDFTAYLNGPYAEPAAIPEMPWKTNPTHAVIAGTVTGPDGLPVIDCHLEMDGDSFVYTTGGDGFYAVLDVPTGTRTITATSSVYGTRTATVTVQPGDAARLDVRFTLSGGTINFDKAVYTSTESPVITVTDSDLEGDGSLDITVSSNRETTPQAVTLTETAPGEFQGTITLADAPPVDADGSLQIGIGGTLTATYQDAFNGDGPATVTATSALEPRILDNDEVGFTATAAWLVSTFGNNYGINKRYVANANPTEKATWAFSNVSPARYRIDFWVNDNDYAANAEYRVFHDGAVTAGELTTRSQAFVGDGWQTLGEFEFSGTAALEVTGNWTGAGRFVVADAMQLTFVGEKAATVDPPEVWFVY